MPTGAPDASETDPLLGREDGQGDNNIEHSFSFRALLAGMLIGILVNLSNTYYGLQTGSSQQMPIVSALLGFLVFSLLSKLSFAPLSKAENVLIVSAATATGCMPVTAGFAELIPALEYILEPRDGGPMHLRWSQMALWSIGLCFFGIVFAALLRRRLVVPKDQPWPGATASSNVIAAFYARRNKNGVSRTESQGRTYEVLEDDHSPASPQVYDEVKGKVPLMLKSGAFAAVMVRIITKWPV